MSLFFAELRKIWGGRVWSPSPTEATLAVRSNGPMYLGHGFRQPNFATKFGASVMGIGPYGGRHAESSCPTGAGDGRRGTGDEGRETRDGRRETGDGRREIGDVSAQEV